MTAEISDRGFWPTHLHLKRGSSYQYVTVADVQTSRPIVEGDQLVIYKNAENDATARLVEEFTDGRFKLIDEPHRVFESINQDGAEPLYDLVTNVVAAAEALCASINEDWVNGVCDDNHADLLPEGIDPITVCAKFTDLGQAVQDLEESSIQYVDRDYPFMKTGGTMPVAARAVGFMRVLIAKLRGRNAANDFTVAAAYKLAKINHIIEYVRNPKPKADLQ